MHFDWRVNVDNSNTHYSRRRARELAMGESFSNETNFAYCCRIGGSQTGAQCSADICVRVCVCVLRQHRLLLLSDRFAVFVAGVPLRLYRSRDSHARTIALSVDAVVAVVTVRNEM